MQDQCVWELLNLSKPLSILCAQFSWVCCSRSSFHNLKLWSLYYFVFTLFAKWILSIAAWKQMQITKPHVKFCSPVKKNIKETQVKTVWECVMKCLSRFQLGRRIWTDRLVGMAGLYIEFCSPQRKSLSCQNNFPSYK